MAFVFPGHSTLPSSLSGHSPHIFCILPGNQILGLASGAKTCKMKFGVRGLDQPHVDTRIALDVQMQSTKSFTHTDNHQSIRTNK